MGTSSGVPVVGASVEMQIVNHERPVARGDGGFSVAKEYGRVEGDGAQQCAVGTLEPQRCAVAAPRQDASIG
jgi:hypothetical protein